MLIPAKISVAVLLVALLGCGPSTSESDRTRASSYADSDWEKPAGAFGIDDSRPPIEFMVSIGGNWGPSYRIEFCDNGNLLYLHNPNGFFEEGCTSEEIEVTEDEWLLFRDRLNELEIWKWKRRYDNPGVYDGTNWKLKLVYFNQTIESFGSNAFPDQSRFDSFLKAVSDLVGGNRFE